ncbi:MAG: PASTA domain-containing protein [Marinilabiliaceae bacterium]|nr:PASTA domain-containing protein [Marinilabiliaceae bacterium]
MGFIKSRLFLWQIALAIVLSIVLLFLVSWSLTIYTRSGRIIMVPNVEGRLVNEIDEALANVELSYEINDSMYVNGARPGEIIAQTPAAGKQVKKGRTILLTINPYTREMVNMPQLVDYSIRNAQVVLETIGLRLGPIKYKPSEFDGLVLSQQVDGKDIAQNARIPKGTVVTLTVGSKMGQNYIGIPNVVGETLYSARMTLESSGFNVGIIEYDNDESKKHSNTAQVYKQEPAGGNGHSAPAGTQIKLYMTNDASLVVKQMVEE